jgi:excisionase family DNA binding protein
MKTPAIRGEALSPKEAAKRMFIGYSTFRNMKRNKCLPFNPIVVGPRKMVIDSADIEDWLLTMKSLAGQNVWKKLLEKYNKGGAAEKNS